MYKTGKCTLQNAFVTKKNETLIVCLVTVGYQKAKNFLSTEKQNPDMLSVLLNTRCWTIEGVLKTLHPWCHHFWPNLASSMLNFCRRKRSFQWWSDQSDRQNGALDIHMHKNAQKVERKPRTKISCHCTWLLHGKNCPSRWRFLRSFLTGSKPSRRSITGAKRKEKENKERREKFQKSQHFDFCACRIKMSQNVILVARKASCRVANAFSTRLKLIWLRSSLKTTKTSKNTFFCQKLQESIG